MQGESDMRNLRILAGAAAFVVGVTGAAWAVIEFDQNITPGVIFGSGNANGEFTTDRQNGIEIGLLAKIPFDPAGINSNGDGTYSYTLAETDHDSDGGVTTPRRWNFDWTVNTNFDNSSGLMLDNLTYEMGLDSDPTLETNFLKFDPITPSVFVPVFDHSIGDNSTDDTTDIVAGDAAT